MSASCYFFFTHLPHVLIFIFYSTIMATVHLPKRRKTGHRPPPMVEGSSQSWDTAIYIHEGGDKNLVPVQLNDPAQDNAATEPDLSMTDPDVYSCTQEPADMEQNFDSHNLRTKKGSFYMREFVARVDGILQALQAQEALPSHTICAECSKFLGHWRCEDCIGGKLLC